MIKFFRTIRRQLLAERKFQNYVLYALGEIGLVVIGILIALQANNYKEDLNAAKVKNKYTSSIMGDFKKDSLSLKVLINQLERDSSLLVSFQKRLSNKQSNIDSIIKIYRYEFPFSLRPDYSFNNTTLIQLIGNNSVSYSTEIRESFAALIKIQEDFERANTIFIDKYFDILNGNSMYPSEKFEFDSGKEVRDEIWSQVDKVAFAAYFDKLANWKMTYTKVILGYAKGILTFTSKIKKDLQLELEG